MRIFFKYMHSPLNAFAKYEMVVFLGIYKRKKKGGKDEIGKVYECRFCSLKFGKSQALGGHMNRHRQGIFLSTHSHTSPFVVFLITLIYSKYVSWKYLPQVFEREIKPNKPSFSLTLLSHTHNTHKCVKVLIFFSLTFSCLFFVIKSYLIYPIWMDSKYVYWNFSKLKFLVVVVSERETETLHQARQLVFGTDNLLTTPTHQLGYVFLLFMWFQLFVSSLFLLKFVTCQTQKTLTNLFLMLFYT